MGISSEKSRDKGHMKNKEPWYFADFFFYIIVIWILNLQVLDMSQHLVFNPDPTS